MKWFLQFYAILTLKAKHNPYVFDAIIVKTQEDLCRCDHHCVGLTGPSKGVRKRGKEEISHREVLTTRNNS